jgi:hypothetical protein
MRDDPWTAANPDKEQQEGHNTTETQANGGVSIASIQADGLGTILER